MNNLREKITISALATTAVALVALLVLTNESLVITIPKRDEAKIIIQATMNTALQAYAKDIGSYPTTTQGLKALIIDPAGVANWHGPYLTEIPKDPWGREYYYKCPGDHNPSGYDLWSLGGNGDKDTSKMIGNW